MSFLTAEKVPDDVPRIDISGGTPPRPRRMASEKTLPAGASFVFVDYAVFMWYDGINNKVEGRLTMDNETLAFVVYMIHRCANSWGLTPKKVYRMLEDSGCIQSYLVPHYAVLHTQSSNYVMDDIRRYLWKRGIAV